MLLGRAAIYFDEVARRGALRRAADVLHIAPSAVDRQILQLEDELGTQLFERTPTGMRMTAAGEVLIDGVRRWRRDLERIRSEIDNLVGLRRGRVSIALVEGAVELAGDVIAGFQKAYPAIQYNVQVWGSQKVVDLVLAGEVDIGLTFNPPDNPTLRIGGVSPHKLGVVARPGHPVAREASIALAECVAHGLIVPAENLSLRRVLDRIWQRSVGGALRATAEVNSIGAIKYLTLRGVGLGLLTDVDVLSETREGVLTFVPLRDEHIDLSTLSVVSATGRTLSLPATLLLQHLADAMTALQSEAA